VKSWTFQISFAELLLSCSSAELLDERTYIIRLPLKLVLRRNLIRCGVCIFPVVLWFREIIRGNVSSRSETCPSSCFETSSEECSEYERYQCPPESDPVWSSCIDSGSGLARASCAFPGSDPAWSSV
ncbi:hypothetical protein Tco_0376261, partial [Tanacetum coccineum]